MFKAENIRKSIRIIEEDLADAKYFLDKAERETRPNEQYEWMERTVYFLNHAALVAEDEYIALDREATFLSCPR